MHHVVLGRRGFWNPAHSANDVPLRFGITEVNPVTRLRIVEQVLVITERQRLVEIHVSMHPYFTAGANLMIKVRVVDAVVGRELFMSPNGWCAAHVYVKVEACRVCEVRFGFWLRVLEERCALRPQKDGPLLVNGVVVGQHEIRSGRCVSHLLPCPRFQRSEE